MQEIRFLGRVAKPRHFKIGTELENGVETVRFELPDIAEGQTALIYWKNREHGDVEELEDGEWTIKNTMTQYPGEALCFIEISDGDELLWRSEVFTAEVAALPDAEGTIEQVYPTAIQAGVAAAAASAAAAAASAAEAAASSGMIGFVDVAGSEAYFAQGALDDTTGEEIDSLYYLRSVEINLRDINGITSADDENFMQEYAYDENHVYMGYYAFDHDTHEIEISKTADKNSSTHFDEYDIKKLIELGASYVRVTVCPYMGGYITLAACSNLTLSLSRLIAIDASIQGLETKLKEGLYVRETDTDAFYWRSQIRVNSVGQYAINQTHYAGVYLSDERDYIYVYPGSTVMAKTGYIMDYSIRRAPLDDAKLESKQGVAAGEKITISNEGYLRISVTDTAGSLDTSTDALAKQAAKAGLEIDLILKVVRNTVFQNEADIAEIRESLGKYDEALERGDEWKNYVTGKSIVTNLSIGSTVDVSMATAGTMACGVIPVEAGDKYAVTGKAFTQSLLWAFTDESYKLISKSAGNLNVTDLAIVAPADGYLIVNAVKAAPHALYKKTFNEHLADDVRDLMVSVEKSDVPNNDTALVAAQKDIAADWHFAFIDIAGGMGLGSNHMIPGTRRTWEGQVQTLPTTDLDQKGVWMKDGVHPHLGTGVRAMYAQTIAPQLAMVAPDYRDGVGLTSPSVWAGRTILWLGTSIPAGKDPNTQNDDRDPYPKLVATMLGATCKNAAEGSSCVRINASTGTYNGMKFTHFLRALTRTNGECEDIIDNWDSYKVYYSAHDTLTADEETTIREHSFEQILLPYLDGSETMPDLFVIDHGHNDVSPVGIDGESDLWIEPTLEAVQHGLLAEDTYMTETVEVEGVDVPYKHLKDALNNDLSDIPDIASFAATLNRNCFKGAMNFLITVILSYNPHARIVIVGDYN